MRIAVLIAVSAALASAHDVITTKITWSKEISRLIFKRCASCHREGGSSFSLMTYDEARPWAKAIKEEVLERRMPPWEAVKGFGEFKDDRGLSGEEMELISDWVEGGAPEGEAKLMPAAPKPEAWLDPAVPKGSSEVVVGSDAKLNATARVVAVRVKNLKDGASVQMIAARPDGTIEPLLWIYQYNSKYKRTYYFKSPVNLPAGTQIAMSPPGAGTVVLFAAASKVSSGPARGISSWYSGTVSEKKTTELIVPAKVRRKAGIRLSDRLEFKVARRKITITALPDEYSPAERRKIDSALAKAQKGPYHGPFTSADEAMDFVEKQIPTKSRSRAS